MSIISKLGLGIVAFEGTEHIKSITYEIRNEVEHIVVCLQKTSYHGKPIEESDITDVERLKEVGLIDDIIWFEPKSKLTDSPASGRIIETDKRNFILQYLEDNGCSHSIVIDSDEFYEKEDFKRAKNQIEKDDIHVSYCQYINYWKDYTHYLVWPFACFVPFICESKYRFEFGCKCAEFAIDPTRIIKLNDKESYGVFSWNTIHMHHLSWIRIDIRKKIMSWSAQKYFPKELLEKVYNKYMNWKEYEYAYIMFNVPGNKICVINMGKSYIKPHYMLFDKI